MYLTRTIRSIVKPAIVYGVKGTQVEVISEAGDVCIVEDTEGNKFSVTKDELSEEFIERDPGEVITPLPVKTGKRKSVNKQKSLF